MRFLLIFSIVFTTVIIMITAVLARDFFLIYAIPIFIGALNLHYVKEEVSFRFSPLDIYAAKIAHFLTHIIGLSLLVFFLVVLVIQPWLRSVGMVIS
ncbi:MAG: hypothetical protein L3J04_08090 [Robiginitomaculum sp.]|nr:hypothetical protein [Robiginitomaculum sp.]